VTKLLRRGSVAEGKWNVAEKIKRTSIQSKIIVSFIFATVLMSIPNLLLIRSSINNNKQYNEIISNITNANSINGKVKDAVDYDLYRIIHGYMSFEEGRQDKIIDEAYQNIEQIRIGLLSDDSSAILDTVKSVLDSLNESISELKEMVSQGKPVSELEQILENIRLITSTLEENIQDFILHELQNSEEVRKVIEKNSINSIIFNIGILCLVIFFSLISAWMISKNISRPIKKMCETTHLIAEGDLNVEYLEPNSSYEINSLAESFNKMLDSLKDIVVNLYGVCTKLSTQSKLLQKSSEENSMAGQEIAASSQKLVSCVYKQNCESQKAKDTVSKIFNLFNKIMSSNDKILSGSNMSVQLAEDGNKYIKDFMAQLKSINEVVYEASMFSQKFNSSAGEMNNILKSIVKISSQTNLLALNASIEAAKAGEIGKGFSVVAYEIRKLAEEARSLAKVIEDIIKSIQADSELMMEKMKKSIEEVELGNKAAEEAGISFEKIKNSNMLVNEDILKISSKLHEAEKMVKEINNMMENIERDAGINQMEGETIYAAVEEQTANLEEVASSSSTLTDLVSEIEQSIKRFKI